MRGYGRNNSVGLALATSANGTKRTGAVFPPAIADDCAIQFQSQITTSAVAATFVIEASQDNVNWWTVTLPNFATQVNTAVGTGSPVTTTYFVEVPKGVFDNCAYIRGSATLSGAATAGADQTLVKYYWTRAGTVGNR